MAGTFFYNEADESIFKAIERRKGLIANNYQQSVMVRNAYCEIMHENGTIIYMSTEGGVLPLETSSVSGRSFADTYIKGSTGKPKTTLIQLEVTKEGTAGSLRRCSGTFLCHTLDEFNRLEENLLLPSTKITVKYGYSHAIDETDYSPILNFTVYDYSFTLNDANNIECSFKAVGKGQEILEANAFNSANFAKLSSGDSIPQFIANYNGGNETRAVTSIADALDYLVQREVGKLDASSFDPKVNSGWFCDQRSDGDRANGERTGLDFCIMEAPSDYEPPGKQKVGGTTFDRITYYSLGFICWVINNFIARDEPTNIICDGHTTIGRVGKTAWTYGPSSPGRVYKGPLPSGDPIMCAFLSGTDLDNYADGGDKTDGDNLRFDLLDIPDTAVITGGDLSRVLISRDCIQALQESYRTVDSSGKDTSKISIKRFLGDIFATIKDCSGGGIDLFMMEDPSDEFKDLVSRNGEPFKRVLVKNGNEPPSKSPKVVQFDPLPIDGRGDGITKSIKLTGKVPKGIQAEAFGSTPGSGDAGTVITAITEKTDDAIDQSAGLWDRFVQAHNNLAYEDFSAAACSGLKGILKEVVDNESPEEATKNKTIPYPLEMECLLHGIYGFKFGDTVSSKHLPRRYTKDSGMRVGFTVTSTKDKIEGDKWTTELTTTCRIVNN